MTPRERAQLRLNRRVPGSGRQQAARLADRIAQRDEEKEPFLPPRACRVRDEVQVKRIRPVIVSAYAPQLIRLVRRPFAMSPVRSSRLHGFERPSWVREARAPMPQPAREMAGHREGFTLPSPIAANPHRPELRPHPFARARTRSTDEDTR